MEATKVRGHYGRVYDVPFHVQKYALTNACEDIVRAREIARQPTSPVGLERLIHNEVQRRLEGAVGARQGDLDKCLSVSVYPSTDGTCHAVHLRVGDGPDSRLSLCPWPAPDAAVALAAGDDKPRKKKSSKVLEDAGASTTRQEIAVTADAPIEIVCAQRHAVEILWRAPHGFGQLAHLSCACGERVVRLPHHAVAEGGVVKMLLENLENLTEGDKLHEWLDDLTKQVVFMQTLERALRRIRKLRGDCVVLHSPRHLTVSERRLLERATRAPKRLVLVDLQDEP